MAQRLPKAKVYSFEPLSAAYARLRGKTSGNGRYETFNCALGNVNERLTIHRSPYSPSSSILPMTTLHQTAFPITAGDAGTEEIDVRRLDDIADDLEIADDLFVKIDVQGFEADVIRGGCRTLKRAKAIIVETSFEVLYENQALFDQIYMMMKKLGFTYAGNWEQLLDPQSGRVLQADAIFKVKAAC
jgi:FkbM family methyltransferase